jgi:hypothetical protein
MAEISMPSDIRATVNAIVNSLLKAESTTLCAPGLDQCRERNIRQSIVLHSTHSSQSEDRYLYGITKRSGAAFRAASL